MRRLELAHLKLWGLDTERGTVTIQGKGKKDRIIPMGERAARWVHKYVMDARPQIVADPDEGTVFVSNLGEVLSLDYLTELVRSYVEASGIEKHGACHMFRHTCATLMLEGGADIRFIPCSGMPSWTQLKSTRMLPCGNFRKSIVRRIPQIWNARSAS